MKGSIGVQRIAQRADVSIGTVDRALHDRPGINQKTRERVLRIARELGYKPNLAARALSLRRARKRIAVCLPREIHYFYDQLWEGIYDEARKHRDYGINFVFKPLRGTGEDEAVQLEKVLRAGVQGVIVAPNQPAALARIIDRAEEMNVRVVCVSTDAAQSKRSSIVSIDPKLSGLLAGELMSKFVTPGAKVAIVSGGLRTDDYAKRTDGFSSAFLRYCTHGSIDRVIEATDLTGAFEEISALLERASDLQGIYVNTANCLPACRALEAKGLNGRVKLIVTDLFEEMTPYIENQTIAASIDERPYQQGRRAISALIDHVVHGIPLEPAIYLSPNIAMSSNLHLFREWIQPQFSAKQRKAFAS